MVGRKLEIKTQPHPDLVPAAVKAKSWTIIVVEFPIVSRLPLSEGFSLSTEDRMKGKKGMESEVARSRRQSAEKEMQNGGSAGRP